MQGFEAARERMVAEQIAGRGVRDDRVLDAMRSVPREAFVDPEARARAYEDGPLPIGHGQTISQPYVVARMCEMARLGPDDRVLEVGAGSGYQTAVLASLVEHVTALEIVPELADSARAHLDMLGFDNVALLCADGSGGYPEGAPYDAIVVGAGAPRIPSLLVAQLADGGRLILPVGPRRRQRLAVVTRNGEDYSVDLDTAVRFVDLVGRYGWGGAGAPQA